MTELGSLLAAVLSRAQSFLLDPVAAPDAPLPLEPIEISVIGTCAGCGVSTVASGLRLVLASPVSERAEAVSEPAGPVVLVTPGGGDPAIAALVGALLSERFSRLLLVANRVKREGHWNGHADVCLPESRFGAALIARGRRPPGQLGAGLARLAALVEQGQLAV